MKTRAAQLRKPGEVVLLGRDLALGDDEVLVKGHLSGICGSDKDPSAIKAILKELTRAGRCSGNFVYKLPLTICNGRKDSIVNPQLTGRWP